MGRVATCPCHEPQASTAPDATGKAHGIFRCDGQELSGLVLDFKSNPKSVLFQGEESAHYGVKFFAKNR
jgi:hypothetical protein